MITTKVMDGMMENCMIHSCVRAETIMTRFSESCVSQRDHCAYQTLAGDGHGELHTPQRLQGLDHRLRPPGLHLLVEFVFETLQALSVLVHGPDIFLEDDLLRRGRTDHLREPAQAG
jgi:hypothetical protein